MPKQFEHINRKHPQLITSLIMQAPASIKRLCNLGVKSELYVSQNAYLQLRYKHQYMGVKQKGVFFDKSDYTLYLQGYKVVRLLGWEYFDTSVNVAVL